MSTMSKITRYLSEVSVASIVHPVYGMEPLGFTELTVSIFHVSFKHLDAVKSTEILLFS